MRRSALFAAVLALGLSLAQYQDVKPQDPEWLALQALTEMGVVYGYPDGTFRGDRAVSRREMVLFLYRLWLKAKEVGDKALEELAQRLAKDMAGLASVQAALEDRLAQLEATAKAALRPEDREAILAEVATLRTTLSSVEEAVSTLTSQYADLLDRQKKAEEALAAMDQRTLAWSEDSVLLQKEVKGLKEETAKALEEARQAQARLENALRQALSQESAVLRQSLESTFQEAKGLLAALEEKLRGSEGRLGELEARLTATREEVFRLSEELRKAKEELARRVDELSYAPPPLGAGVVVSGLSPLSLSGFIGHDSLIGAGVRVGVDYRQDTGEFRPHGLLYFPVYREPARGVVGFGLSYALSGPAQGESAVLFLVGLGVNALSGVEVYGEAKAFYPLDGSTPFARVGFGVKVRP